MATMKKTKAAVASVVVRNARKKKDAKKPKSYRLSSGKIAAAQRILGTKTATATIETALDMVVFRKELVHGAAQLFGLDVVAIYRR